MQISNNSVKFLISGSTAIIRNKGTTIKWIDASYLHMYECK